MRWIIGDVHGMLRPLETVIAEIARRDEKAVLYFVGDYVNRGKESRGVIDLLLSLDNARFIRGNHDDVLDQILHGASYAENPSRGDRFMAFQWFLEHGLFETLQSYGVTRDQIGQVFARRNAQSLEPIIDRFPIEHRMFIRSLGVFIEDDDLFVVHGKWPMKETATPAMLLGEGSMPIPAMRHEMLWGRFTDAELHRAKPWPKTGFFGHTPVPTYRGHEDNCSPIICARMILLDTAAALCAHGRLTAMCAESGDLVRADPAGKLVEVQAEQR
jgi:serine/threonine protein phosphatase 1